jgi:succinate-semialdehyde dehydrogenase/glutarate-semialdehyde dehydrogenase
MLTRKIGPAIAAGCSVVCKLPSETPLTALALAELADRAGLPPGTVNCITSSSAHTPTIGKYMCESPTIRKISLTGSTQVGKLLMSQSSSTLKKLSFELGGNAPFIVFDDADVGAAVQGALLSKFRQSGTTCVCANRIFVQRGIYDEFVAGLVEGVAKFKVGNGFDQGTTHGPLIHDRAVKKVQQHVTDALDHGAECVIGGEQLSSLGANFYAPTVLKNVTTEMMLTHEETFGPLAGILPFDTEEEVIKIANAESVGLAGYFFSQDITRCYRVAEALEVGMLGVNTGLISDSSVPFGGIKESGFGREGSHLGVDEYTVWKSVTIGGF